MRLVKIEREAATAEGILIGDTVHVVGDWHTGSADAVPFTLGGRGLAELQKLAQRAAEAVPLASVSLAVPIDPRAQIFCAGFNYRAHLSEMSSSEPQHPVIFKRTLDTLVPHGQAIVRPKASIALDYEGEIAVMIGRPGRYIAEDRALSHVGGYSCFLDGSVRDFQKHSVTSGKNFWHTGSLGPWIVTPDEVGDRDIELATYVDGEQRQSSTASHMIFSIARLIAYCSTLTWLRPGDLIATGTPAGVASGMKPPRWLQPGNVVEVDIGGVGRLRNVVAEETPTR